MKDEVNDTGSVPEFFASEVLAANRFYLDASPRDRKSFSVVCGGSEHCQPDYAIHRDDFPFFAIEFVARGRGTLVLKRKTISLVPGMVFAYGPGISQHITTDPDDRMVKYFVDFTGAEAKAMLRKHAPKLGQAVQVAHPQQVLHIFEDLIKNGQRGTRYSSPICAVLVQHLILKIAETATKQGANTTAAFSTYQACRDFITKNYLHLQTLEEAAETCEIDTAYLCRLFKRFDDESPYHYLIRLKMNEAAKRLHEPNTLIKQVAYDLGFSDPFHFSRAFKRIFGLSPNAFRQIR